MASVPSFIRNTPLARLRAYFSQYEMALQPAINWDAPEPDVILALLRAVDEMDDAALARVTNDAERIAEIADEPGQAALYSVLEDREHLDRLRNPHDRALWMLLNEPVKFRHAEEVRFTDERRRGRMWDGFVSDPRLTLHRNSTAVDAFKQGVRERFRSKNVYIDIFDRHRATFDGDDSELVQVTVYREGLPDDFLEFENGALVHRPRRPVFEAALTYEPAPGVIEVVANDRESREELVRFLARFLLDAEFGQERLPRRRYDLSILLQPFTFPTDPADGIESVRVNQLRLMPIDTVAERVTLECTRQTNRTIWEMARERFHDANPLLGAWVVTQAKLTIRFHPDAGSRRGKIMPLAITMPHGCDLKDRTDRERIVGNKYLRNWGILRDV